MKRFALLLLLLAPCSLLRSQGWPYDYGGVMMQGFYWDSYDETSWSKLQAQADEIAPYFQLIWIPQSGWCNSNFDFQFRYRARDAINTRNWRWLGWDQKPLSAEDSYKQYAITFVENHDTEHRINGKKWFRQTYHLTSPEQYVNIKVSNTAGNRKTIDVRGIRKDCYLRITGDKDEDVFTVEDQTDITIGIGLIQDDELRIQDDAYDLSGKRMAPHTPKKDVVIENGRKVAY